MKVAKTDVGVQRALNSKCGVAASHKLSDNEVKNRDGRDNFIRGVDRNTQVFARNRWFVVDDFPGTS